MPPEEPSGHLPDGPTPTPHSPAPPRLSPAPLSPDTLAVVTGRPPRVADASVNEPIELTSTYIASSQAGARGYGRTSNRTWEALEEALGALEDASAVTFASGMAAVSAAVHVALAEATGRDAAPGTRRIPRVVAPEGAYNTTLALLNDLAASGGLDLAVVDVADTSAVLAALDAAPTSLLWLESPTNPLLTVADLPALCEAARARGVVTVVDNTFATPLVQRPLDAGADVVVHAATKYLAGHSDVLLGAALTRDGDRDAALRRHRSLHGGIPGPFEAWLTLRGLRTLPLRVARSQASAVVLAQRLATSPAVARVRHPSLADDPGHARARAQMRGFGSVISVEMTGGVPAAEALQSSVRLWLPATSLGGVESMLERRRRHPLEPTVVPPDLVRLSVGIEDVEDLWDDLAQALDGLP